MKDKERERTQEQEVDRERNREYERSMLLKIPEVMNMKSNLEATHNTNTQ